MTIADKLTLLANSKEALRVKLKIPKSVPFSKYPDYVDWASVPSIPNKAFYADFANDRYVKDGVPCNFNDLFTFNRAGKAWLVKESGLQEYVADVPRFDNGLLIEQSATNLLVNSVAKTPLLAGSLAASSFTEYTITDQMSELGYNSVNITNGHLRQDVTLIAGGFYTLSMALKQGYKEGVFYSHPAKMPSLITLLDNGTPLINGVLSYSQNVTSGGETSVRFGKSVSTTTGQPPFVVSMWQLERSGVRSSFIPTTTVPVTRPADFLLNNITGTTVTGDWDSTLTLSIEEGKLVHSGYGRIRFLEIN